MLALIENCCRHPSWTNCVLDLLEDKQMFKLGELMSDRFTLIWGLVSLTISIFNASFCPTLMIFLWFAATKAKGQGNDIC